MRYLLVAFMLLAFSAQAPAQTVEFDFAGNGGSGLLPSNEVGANTSLGSASVATGDETGSGLVFDTSTNALNVNFSFQGLDGGLLAAAASGIHLHLPGVPNDPFNQNGGIVFNLNSFSDTAVTNSNSQIADGATSGTVNATVDFSNNLGLVDDLLAGEFYLNIHSQTFGGGELRGTLVNATAIPEPSSIAFLGLMLGSNALIRRRKQA